MASITRQSKTGSGQIPPHRSAPVALADKRSVPRGLPSPASASCSSRQHPVFTPCLIRAERAWNRNLDALAHKVNANAERVAVLEATAAAIDAAITRRQDTRGDAFTMTIGATRHTRRQGAGEHLKTLIAGQDQALTRSGHRRLAQPLGELGGFPLTGPPPNASSPPPPSSSSSTAPCGCSKSRPPATGAGR